MLDSVDHFGPLVNPRTLKIWTDVDPCGAGKSFQKTFDLSVVDAISTVSRARVRCRGIVMDESDPYDDYDGFGAGREHAMEAARQITASCSVSRVSVVVTTTVTIRTAYFDTECEPFQPGAVRCCYVPDEWFRADEQGSTKTTLVFEIWRDGKPGKDAGKLEALIAEYVEADVVGERRKSAPIEKAS
ncbi:hypothetical protein PsAD37_03837 [Pseudovibrio sp. Ad37]|nr:hypothetical protein PsAD37_03837 [Pseudovibrio sp. Ad37]